MSIYRADVLSSVDEITPSDWARLAPADDPLWSQAFFRVMEQGAIGPDGFEYLVLRRNGALAAILPAFWYRNYALPLGLGGELEQRLDRLRRTVPGFLALSLYFCGNPLGEGRILADRSDPEIGAALLRLAEQRAAARDIAWVILKDFAETTARGLTAASIKSPFFRLPALPDASLALRWPSFEDYLSKSKFKVRQNIRRRLRSFDSHSELRIMQLDRFDDRVPEMFPLYEKVLSRAKLVLDRLTPSFFAGLAGDRTIDTRLIACVEGDRMVGFVLCLVAGKGAVCLRGGFDYERSRESGCYFVLLYEAIRLAIGAGCEALSFGQATYQPKMAIGCGLVPLHNVVTYRNPLLRPVLKQVLPLLLERYGSVAGLGKAA